MRTLPWRHLAVLTGLAATFFFVTDLLTGAPARAGGWAGAPAAAVLALPDTLYTLFPVIAGLAVGTLRLDRRPARTAARVVVVVTAAMLGLDVLAAPWAAGAAPVASTAAVHGRAREGAIGTAVALATGRLRGTGEVRAAYPADHPRWLAEQAVVRATMLLLPAVLVGIVLGVGFWVRAHVLFRAPRDEVVARWVLAWLVVPGAFALLVAWSSGYGYAILFRGESLWLPLLPYLPGAALAVVGWRAAARAGTPLGGMPPDAPG